MEALDGSNRQSGILSIINRETSDHPNHSSPNPYPSTTMAAAVVANPSFGYSSEPHPRYEVSSVFTGRSSSLHGLISPPESRRTSDNKNEVQPPQHRQSLPSIHEALGPKPAYTPPTSATLPTSHDLPFSQSQAPSVPRSYPPSDHVQYTAQLPPPQSRQRTPPQLHPQSIPFSRPEAQPFTEVSRHPSAASLQTAPAPPPNPYTPTRYEPPRYDPDARASERGPPSGFPPPSHPSYTYGPGPVPPHNGQHQPIFSQPQYHQSREYRETREGWKAGREADKNEPIAPYRQGTKRERDLINDDLHSYEFENTLAEINLSSAALTEWSSVYRNVAQEQLRSVNVLPDRMPTLESIQDMQRHQNKIAECLQKMNQIIDQAQKQSERALMEQRSQEHSGRPGDYDDEMSIYADDMKNHGFTAEGKKRRGRAAPPGRCHSCNRAETPEWRRGPDGARTLCNACGLHYAKLTRKNTLKTSQGSNGSALRPKSLDEVSPRPL